MKNQLPPPTPPYTGGETNARNRHDVTPPRVLPLCKGELEGVVKVQASYGWNLKSKIKKSQINNIA